MSVQLKSLEEELLARADHYERRSRYLGASGDPYVERARLFKELAAIVARAEEFIDE